MLFKADILDRIADGSVGLAFRRWRKPSVKVGTRLRTPIGIVEILSVELVEPDGITEDEARRAGSRDRQRLLEQLRRSNGGDPYRIAFRYAGRDPRASLRDDVPSDPAAIAALLDRVRRLDANSRHGAWVAETLSLIATMPAIPAADLAKRLGREKLSFKADVRKLKEIGLTESLEAGYRLSPRGRAALGWLRESGRTQPHWTVSRTGESEAAMPDFQKFFEGYVAAFNRSLAGPLDAEGIRSHFADVFIAAGAGGVNTGRNDETFAKTLEGGYAFYKSIGTRNMELLGIEPTEIDAHHHMVKVFYRADYVKKDGGAVSIDFDVTYLLQATPAGPKIFAFIAGDETALYRKYGLIA